VADPLRLALDQNFPLSVLNMAPALPEFELVPIRRIDRRLGELDDRSLIIALHPLGWAGLVTNNSGNEGELEQRGRQGVDVGARAAQGAGGIEVVGVGGGDQKVPYSLSEATIYLRASMRAACARGCHIDGTARAGPASKRKETMLTH
jgi:hypothetical protein